MSRRMAEWYQHGPLVSKEVGDRIYEVWCNGTFQCYSPDGEGWKSGDDATDWLVARGITNDQQLNDIVFGEKDGWTYAHNKWFELIVSELQETYPNGIKHWFELYSGDIDFEYNEEAFNDWIDEAIARDNKEE